MKFFGPRAEVILRILVENHGNSWARIRARLPDATEVFVLDEVRGGPATFMEARVFGAGSQFFVFAKDDYLFIGPWADHAAAACPHCLLLSVAVDGETLARIRDVSVDLPTSCLGAPPIIDPVRSVGCWDMVRGKSITVSLPLKHPACPHEIENVPLPVPAHVATTDSLVADLSDPCTGLFRRMVELKDWCPTPVRDMFGDTEVVLSWFQNPVFPLFPAVGVLDLAIGTDWSFEGARRRAVFETIERYAVLSPPERPADATGTAASLGSEALDPTSFWRYSDRQLQCADFPFRPLDSNSRLNWHWVHAVDGTRRLAPEDFVFVNCCPPSPFNDLTTSGCAAHVSPSAAMLNALVELIERHHALRHWMSGRPRPHVDLRTLPRSIARCVARLADIGYDVYLIDCSGDDGVFVFEAALFNTKGGRPASLITSGASCDAVEAAFRALREATGALLLARSIEGSRGDRDLDPHEVIAPEDHAIFYRRPERRALLQHYTTPGGICDFTEFATRHAEKTPAARLALLDAELTRREIDCWFADLTPRFCAVRGVSIYRAHAPALLPLTFGTGLLKLAPPADAPDVGAEFVYDIPHPFS